MLLVASVCFLSVFYLQRDVMCDDNFSPRHQDTSGWNTSTLRNKRWVSGSMATGGCAGVAAVGDLHYISSPNFPSDYDLNTMCEWRETAPSGCTFEITFTDFDLENQMDCKYDRVEVFDGSSTSAAPLGAFCGDTLPPTIHSSTNGIFIRFVSDASTTFTGFKLILQQKCFCGNDSSCAFHAGEKVCICGKGYAEKDGKCEECNCGNNSICVFEAREKICLCSKGYAQKDGKCEECNCGNSSFCVFEAGEKRCLCSKGFAQNDDKCEECHCEPGYFCNFRAGKKNCVVPQQLEETGKSCKGSVGSIILVSIASVVLLIGLVYAAVRYTRLWKRREDHDSAECDRTSDIQFSTTSIPYRKEQL